MVLKLVLDQYVLDKKNLLCFWVLKHSNVHRRYESPTYGSDTVPPWKAVYSPVAGIAMRYVRNTQSPNCIITGAPPLPEVPCRMVGSLSFSPLLSPGKTSCNYPAALPPIASLTLSCPAVSICPRKVRWTYQYSNILFYFSPLNVDGCLQHDNSR